MSNGKSSPDNSSLQTEEQTIQLEEKETLSTDELRERMFKAIQENKKYREKNRGLEEKLTSLETQRMEEQGKYKDLSESFKSKYDQERAELQKMKASYAFSTVSSQVKLEAQKLGCKDVDVLISFYSKGIREIPIDEGFKVDQASLKDFISKAKTEKPYLFEKDAPKVNDMVPKGNGINKQNLSEASLEELYKQMADLEMKN